MGTVTHPRGRARKDFYAWLDPGIRRYVLILREGGIETFESCQGGRNHAFGEPTVRFHGGNGEGFKALSIAATYRLPVLQLNRYYQIEDGWPAGPEWEIVFRGPCHDVRKFKEIREFFASPRSGYTRRRIDA